MVKISLLPDKNEKRIESFESVATDVKVILKSSRDGGIDAFFTVEFGEEAPLSINMRLSNWVKAKDSSFSPKPASSIYKMLASFQRTGIEVDFDVDAVRSAALVDFQTGSYPVKTTPSILGKTCSFNSSKNTFTSDNEVDDTTGEPKVVTFYVWTLKSAKGSTLENFSKPKQAENVPAVQSKETQEVPADMDVITRNWLEIISELPEKFKFPEIMAAKAKYVDGKTFSQTELKYFNNTAQVKSMIDILVSEGYLVKNKMEFSKNDEKILEKLV